MRRACAPFLAIFMLTFIISVLVCAETVVDSGKCGANATYSVYSDGKMIIEGSGKIRSFNFQGVVTSLEISEGITEIGSYVFSGVDSLKSVSLPESLEKIGDMAFYQSGIEYIYIPKNVSELGNMSFSDCGSLLKIEASVNNISFSSANGVLYNKDKTTLLIYPSGANGTLKIPQNTKNIGKCAFYKCKNITYIDFSQNMEIIDDEAFSGSGIVNLTVPENVTFIGNKAFENCTSLEEVKILCKNGSIGDFAFYYCNNLKKLQISSGITSVGQYAFYDCDGLASVKIPESVKTIGERAFSNCNNLLTVVISAFDAEIGEKAIGYDWSRRVADTVIYGVTDSTAQTYSKNKFKFVDVDQDEFLFVRDDIYSSEGYLLGINEKTPSLDMYYMLANKSYKVTDDDILKTGSVVSLSSGKSLTVVVKGDVDGNGCIDSMDSSIVKKMFLEANPATDEFFKASDTDGNGVLTSTDYMQIKFHFLGLYSLS